MEKTPTQLARELLEGDGGIEEVRVHLFEDDASAHDDELHEKLYAEFALDFDCVQADLAAQYGTPWQTGNEDNKYIPLNGVFRFSLWEVNQRLLFVAAAHEDRECPILLMIGTSNSP